MQQGIAALKQAEQCVQAIMNLVRIEPATVEKAGWQEFQKEAFDPNSERPLKSQKELNKYADILGLTTEQLKTVAEIYNPKRFLGETKKHRLLPGEAFDLTLGHDLLNPRMRDEVRKYVSTVKPGLVVVSPPCTLFSLLQNLNMNRKDPDALRQFLKELMKAKVLLRFGVEIIEMVMSYGGFFVFEKPADLQGMAGENRAEADQRTDDDFGSWRSVHVRPSRCTWISDEEADGMDHKFTTDCRLLGAKMWWKSYTSTGHRQRRGRPQIEASPSLFTGIGGRDPSGVPGGD